MAPLIIGASSDEPSWIFHKKPWIRSKMWYLVQIRASWFREFSAFLGGIISLSPSTRNGRVGLGWRGCLRTSTTLILRNVSKHDLGPCMRMVYMYVLVLYVNSKRCAPRPRIGASANDTYYYWCLCFQTEDRHIHIHTYMHSLGE